MLLSWFIITLVEPDWYIELVASVVSVIKKGTCCALPPSIFDAVAAWLAVPINIPVKDPVNDPELYEPVKVLKELVLTTLDVKLLKLAVVTADDVNVLKDDVVTTLLVKSLKELVVTRFDVSANGAQEAENAQLAVPSNDPVIPLSTVSVLIATPELDTIIVGW